PRRGRGGEARRPRALWRMALLLRRRRRARRDARRAARGRRGRAAQRFGPQGAPRRRPPRAPGVSVLGAHLPVLGGAPPGPAAAQDRGVRLSRGARAASCGRELAWAAARNAPAAFAADTAG